MKNIFYAFLIFSLFSCTENDKKLDRETNTYYAKYKFIYENYDSLGIDKSIELLDEYIDEFPNAVNGYTFKAFLLAKDNKFQEAKEVIENYEGSYEEKTINKNYLVSLLLMDTSNLPEIETILESQKSDTIHTIKRDYNLFWYSLYKNDIEKAKLLSTNIIKNDTTSDKSIKRSELLIKAISKDSIFIDSISRLEKRNIYIDKLDSLSRNQISLVHYYKTLSK